MGVSCEFHPKTKDGKDSELYKSLYEKTKNKRFTNLIYASYLQEGVAAEMDEAGYKRDKQGEHRAEDVYKWYNILELLEEQGRIGDIEVQIGSKDSLGNYIEYSSGEEALEIVNDYNSKEKGNVAYTVKRGDKYIIVLEPKTANNQIRAARETENYNSIQTTRQILGEVGLSLDPILENEITKDLIDLTNIKSIFTTFSRIKVYQNRQLSVQDITLLLALNKDDKRVNRLMEKLHVDSVSNLAQKIYDNFSSSTPLINSQETIAMINGLLDDCKKFKGLDIKNAINRINSLHTEFQTSSYEHSVQKVIDDLNNKYNLDFSEVQADLSSITNAKELTGAIIMNLSRQLRELESQVGITEDTINIEEKIKELSESLEHQRYFYGFSSYLSEMGDTMAKTEQLLKQYDKVTGTPLEQATQRAKIITELKAIVTANKYLLNLLSNNTLLLEEASLSSNEISTIQDTALKLLRTILNLEETVKGKADATMLQFMVEIVGSEGINGASAEIITKGMGRDSSIFDYLYCASKISDPRGAVVGTLIRNAQDSRDLAMRNIANRIKRATYKLRKAGITDTSFMYEENDYIISDIDWVKYLKARKSHINILKKQGLTGIELKEAIEQWEFNNTEDRIVDEKSGRTEAVPNGDYRKDMPELSEAEEAYYKTMMQIKGEMGTLLPNVAQKHYVPPQIRRGFLHAIKEPGFKAKLLAVKNFIKGIYTIWEDDADFVKSGVLVGGEEYSIGLGTLEGTVKKDVPIGYINKLRGESKRELLKDFSGALTTFSGIAINYSAMHEVASTVEFIHSQIASKVPKAEDPKSGRILAETTDVGKTRVIQTLQSEGSAKTMDLVRQVIDTQVYGIKTKNQGRKAKLVRSFLKYNGIKKLAVNKLGAIANLVVGEMNALIEAGSSEYFGFSDYLWAKGHLLGDSTLRAPGKIIDFVMNTQNSFDFLLADVFDPMPGRFNEMANRRYHSGIFTRVLDGTSPLVLYGTGEYLLNYTTMYAILHKEKVLLNGEEVSLYEVLEKLDNDDGASELVIKEGATDLNGNPITLNGDYIQSIKRRIRTANESMHGAMSEESKGVIYRNLWGQLVMQFKQWMIEFYSKRFRGEYFDGNTGKVRRGYYREFIRLAKDLKNHDLDYIKAHYNKENDPTFYYNMRRAATEMFLTVALLILKSSLDEPDERKGDYWYRLLIYQTDRAFMEMSAGNPASTLINGAFITNMFKLIDSPVPMSSTLQDTLYPITGLSDLGKEYEKSDKARGIEKGDNIYWYKLPRKLIPFWKHIEDLSNFSEDDSAFKYYR